MTSPTQPALILGIRHHGPGSARSLRMALDAYAPDLVLIEGPPEADPILPLALAPQMRPPVALLIYVPDAPSQAVVYPFAEFSPEWQAIRYALEHEKPARFMDLPQTHWIALNARAAETPTAAPEPAPSPAAISPLDALAQAAGMEDGEHWWERTIEERGGHAGDDSVFPAILEAMAALRLAQAAPTPAGTAPLKIAHDPLEPLREAAMREALRKAHKEGFTRIAVVCGAWHAPALRDLPPQKADRELLKGLPKIKVAAAWVPWSYDHLTAASGYGAGVASPGWYEHLWRRGDQAPVYWLSRVAYLLRKADLDASAAQVIDALRLAETLAAMRGRGHPGLDELREATLTVFCFGDPLPLKLVQEKLIVGNKLGQIPPDAPAAPLQADLAAEQRRLRLKPEADARDYDLDLRLPLDLERSALLHRLTLLAIPWGRRRTVGGAKSTFHELWQLRWDPAFAVKLAAAARWGNTVLAAATAQALEQAAQAPTLTALTELFDQVQQADLPGAVPSLLDRLQAQAALSGDVRELLAALPPLMHALRYGVVRQMAGTAAFAETDFVALLDGLIARICIGLPLACASLDDDAAQKMLKPLESVAANLTLMQHPEWSAQWQATLLQLADQDGLHGLLAGRICRLLLESGHLTHTEIAHRLHLALSPGVTPQQSANWLAGLLRGSGLLLLHDEALWTLLDEWLTQLRPDDFIAALPLLRRTFSAFAAPERRQMGERIARKAASREAAGLIHRQRADAVLPLLTQVLGLTWEEQP